MPLYLRTSNSNSQLSDDEMDLLVNSFLSAGPAASESSSVGLDADADEDVPLWADGVGTPLHLHHDDDFEGKTLQFEESVLRSIRNDALPD